jgi:glycosyltransferase involved in cell wall biosynthesis
MRILMVAQFYPPTIGGEERMVRDLSVELTRRGHHIAVATLWHQGGSDYEVVDGVHVHRIRSASARMKPVFGDPARRYAPPFPDPGALVGLKNVIAQERPDIVHGHNWLVHSFLPLKRSSGAALVLSLHDYSLICANKRLDNAGRTCSGPAPVKCLRCSAGYYGVLKGTPITVSNAAMCTLGRAVVDLFLPVSEAVAAGSRLTKSNAPYRVVPNFFSDLPDRSPAVDAGQLLPELPREFILFVGDVSRDKGVDTLLEAHAQLAHRLPLVIVGRVRQPELISSVAHDVHVVGPLAHDLVLEAWRRATIGVVPSAIYPEPFGLVALEAMRFGRPVVASRIGGLPEVVVHGESGILVRPGDPGDLRHALESLVVDTALRQRLGRAAAQRSEVFSSGRVLPQVEQAYEVALSRKRDAD